MLLNFYSIEGLYTFSLDRWGKSIEIEGRRFYNKDPLLRKYFLDEKTL